MAELTFEELQQRKREQIAGLFATADVEFANGVNALGEKQLVLMNKASEEMTRLYNWSLRLAQKGVGAIDENACDELLSGYEKLEREE